MLIGIDASRAAKAIRTGPEAYSWEIIQHLLKVDSDDEFRLYSPHLPKDHFTINSKTEWKILPQRRLWSQIRLARELRNNPPDVLFVPSHVIPLFSRVPSVVTIHDVAYTYFPQSYSTTQRRYLEFTTGISVRKAKAVIVPSLSTAHDLAKLYPNEKQKIVVVPHSYNARIFKPAAKEDDRPIPEKYILFVGRVEEKKNVRLLVKAFALLAKEGRNVKLVLAGSNGFGFEKVQEEIKALPESVQKLIIQPGYLPQYDLIRYLQHADVFAFPSFYEGFGLAAIEAMACGTPVVCSNTPALAEVVGEAGVLLEPNNPLAWAAAFSRIIHQEKIANEYREKGLKQASQFSWDKAAEQTLAVIKNVAA